MANLYLENFAKIKNSDLNIQDITVIAGKPGTGKSYIMKMLYAINEMFYIAQDDLIGRIDKSNELIKVTEKLIAEVKSLQNKKDIIDLENLNLKTNEAIKSNKEAQKLLNDRHSFDYNDTIRNLVISIFYNYSQISDNFIINYNGIELIFNGSLEVKGKFKGVKKAFGEIIFVETPLILEFKKFMNREKGKTPYHIESLLKILDTDYSFIDQEQNEFIDNFTKKSHNIIQGNIESNGESFIFNKTDGKNYDIINASSGIKSIGLLQYLVTNKALKKDSVLFWEEPEVHLHPTWQLKMIDLFIELMNAGIKIVFSTHSPNMVNHLYAKSKKLDIKNRVSFNLLNEENGVVSNTILDDDNWDLLQDELLGPLEEMMWEYV